MYIFVILSEGIVAILIPPAPTRARTHTYAHMHAPTPPPPTHTQHTLKHTNYKLRVEDKSNEYTEAATDHSHQLQISMV